MQLPHLCIDKGSDQLFLMNRQGQIINANEAACLSLGYQREALQSLRFFDIDRFLSPEVLEKLWEELKHSPSLNFESEHQAQDGGIAPVNIQSRLIHLDGQEYLCAIVKNLTQHQSDKSEYQESNERFRILFDYAAVGMMRLSVNGEFLQVNDAFCRMVGYSREEILAKTITFEQITHPEDFGHLFEQHQQLLSDQIPSFSVEKRCVNKQAAIIWMNLSVSLLRDPAGKPLYFIGTALDITNDKLTEESRSLAAAVLAHTHDGVLITDLEGRIRTVNPAFSKLTGYAEHEVLGLTPRVLKSGRHPPGFYADLWASLESDGHWRGEIWDRHQNGEVQPRMMTISTIKNSVSEATGYVAIFSDISKQKESEAHLDFLAHHDPLTGLPNRRLLEMRVEHALAIATRDRHNVALLMIDLDHFKPVNDRLGHAAGDELLKAVGLRLSKRLRKIDTLARLGGDEFAVLLEGSLNRDAVGRVAQDLLAELSTPVSLADGVEITVGASIGISLFPEHGDRYSELMQHADTALYQAKHEGRQTYRYFKDASGQDVQKWLALEGIATGSFTD